MKCTLKGEKDTEVPWTSVTMGLPQQIRVRFSIPMWIFFLVPIVFLRVYWLGGDI